MKIKGAHICHEKCNHSKNLTFRSKDRKIWNNPVSSEGVTMVFFYI